jgi:hypothetical protein
MANADLNSFYHSMPAHNNHHLQDKHADEYSDRHTAFLKGHQAVIFFSLCVCSLHLTNAISIFAYISV